MSPIELVALGTSSQVPTRQRNHNGYLLRFGDVDFLFDPGEGTQRQLARARVGVDKVRRVFLTHFHGDHSLGLAGVIQLLSAAASDPPEPVRFHFPVSGRKFWERAQEASIFEMRADLRAQPVVEEGELFDDGRFAVTARKLSHGVPCFGYRLEVRDPGQAPFVFAFSMDTRVCPGAKALAEGADVLVSECTYLSSEAREARERGHMTAAHAAELAIQAGVKHLVLTHFSQRYPANRPFLEEARAIHPKVTALVDLKRYGLRP
ncbi:MAG: ribonuclease Z [Myxococcota bacterium]